MSSFSFWRRRARRRPIIDKLNAAFQESSQDPAYVENMTKLYNGIVLLAPTTTARRREAESAAFDPVIAKHRPEAQLSLERSPSPNVERPALRHSRTPWLSYGLADDGMGRRPCGNLRG